VHDGFVSTETERIVDFVFRSGRLQILKFGRSGSSTSCIPPQTEMPPKLEVLGGNRIAGTWILPTVHQAAAIYFDVNWSPL
jgi:hypothetical protein